METKKEIEIAVLERTVTPDNDALQQARLELQELDRKLARYPQAGLAAVRLYRAVITQQKIIEVLAPLYEQAIINEQKDIPVLLVLDKAVPPEKKIKPQRLLIVGLSAFLSFFLCILAVFILHGLSSRSSIGNSVEIRLQAWSKKVANFYRVRIDG